METARKDIQNTLTSRLRDKGSQWMIMLEKLSTADLTVG
jgi:hypothetical protein